MDMQLLAAFAAYFVILIIIGLCAYRKQAASSGSITGSRSLSYWVTAISAHASDMSSWLFMGFPAAVFTTGLFQFWAAVGLVSFMFLNWQFIAPRLRRETERYGCFSVSSYLGYRFKAPSGALHLISSVMALIFFTFYVSAGFVGLGLLFETVFGLPYNYGVTVGITVVVIYIFIGGYVAVAWTDFFQGLFLLVVILVVPVFVYFDVGGYDVIKEAITVKGLSTSILPNFDALTILDLFYLVVGWGLGYFGQLHILSKFMGIAHPNELRKAKYIGITWQILTLMAATAVGLIGIAYFKNGIDNTDLIFVHIVQALFHPLIAGFILCAILAATMSTIDSQILVLANVLTEDFYQKTFRPKASNSELRLVSRIAVILIAVLAFCVAFNKVSSIYELVFYSWTGLGCSFGPILIMALYSRHVNKYGAIAGILSGGIISASWPWVQET